MTDLIALLREARESIIDEYGEPEEGQAIGIVQRIDAALAEHGSTPEEMIKSLKESVASKDLEIDRLLQLLSATRAAPEDISVRRQVLEWAQDVMFDEGEFIAAECLRKLLSTLTHEPESAAPKPGGKK